MLSFITLIWWPTHSLRSWANLISKIIQMYEINKKKWRGDRSIYILTVAVDEVFSDTPLMQCWQLNQGIHTCHVKILCILPPEPYPKTLYNILASFTLETEGLLSCSSMPLHNSSLLAPLSVPNHCGIHSSQVSMLACFVLLCYWCCFLF